MVITVNNFVIRGFRITAATTGLRAYMRVTTPHGTCLSGNVSFGVGMGRTLLVYEPVSTENL